MIAYLRNRLSERSTWIGLATVVAALILFWIFREQIATALVAIAGSTLAALPDRFIKLPIPAALAPVQPALPPAQSPRSIPMSVVSTIAEVLEAAPDLFKLAQDGVAIAVAIETKDFAAIIAGFPQYEADAVKVYNDIFNKGVASATAPVAPVA